MKMVFMTGISGLLGTNLVMALLENGYIVRGLIRDQSKFCGQLHPNLELVEGNIDDELPLEGVDFVVHIAAETRQNLTRYSDYHKVNCEATMQLFEISVQNGIGKFIYVSTANTLGFGSLHDLGNENQEIRSPFNQSFYAKSKLEAECYLLQNKHKMAVVIINPTFMLGAYDSKPSSGKIILFGMQKKVIFYPPGGKNFVHVKDVANAIIKSFTHGKSGDKYLIANENLSYKTFFEKLNMIYGQTPVMVKIPKFLLLTLGYIGDFLKFFNVLTNLSSVNMKVLCIRNFYSNQKSVRQLQMTYRNTNSAINDSLDYFMEKDKS